VENAIFSWREMVLCFWATGVFLGGKSKRFSSLRKWSLELEKKYQISINGKKSSKEQSIFFFGGRRKDHATKFAFEDFIFVVGSAANSVGTINA